MLQQIADRLNELLKIDRKLVESMFTTKFKTGEYDKLLDHPTFVVNSDTQTIRLLGFLNGILRTEDENYGPIAMCLDDDGNITEFIVKKEQ